MLSSNINNHSSFLLATGPRVLLLTFFFQCTVSAILTCRTLIFHSFPVHFSCWEVEHVVLSYFLHVCKGLVNLLLIFVICLRLGISNSINLLYT